MKKLVVIFVIFSFFVNAQLDDYTVIDDMEDISDWYVEKPDNVVVEVSLESNYKTEGKSSMKIFGEFPEDSRDEVFQVMKYFSKFSNHDFLRFSLKSSVGRDIMLLVVLVETDGSVYVSDKCCPLDTAFWRDVTIPFSEFKLAPIEDNVDENYSLDLDQIEVLSLVVINTRNGKNRIVLFVDNMLLLKDLDKNGIPDYDERDFTKIREDARKLFDEGMELYTQNKFLEAKKNFEDAKKIFVELKDTKMIKRTDEMIGFCEAKLLKKENAKKNNSFGGLILLLLMGFVIYYMIKTFRKPRKIKKLPLKKIEKQKVCEYCGRKIEDYQDKCPYCGSKISKTLTREELEKKKKEISHALEALELKYMEGKVSEKEYKKLKEKWNLKLADVEEKILDFEIKS